MIASIELGAILLQEVGHVLGLWHNDIPGSVMYPHMSKDPTSSRFTEQELLLLMDRVGFTHQPVTSVELREMLDRPRECMYSTGLSTM